jgi:hypothetical protein
MWLKFIIAADDVDLAQAAYDKQCTVTTSAADQGGVVDPRIDVRRAVNDCKNEQEKIAQLTKESEKKKAEWHKRVD